MTNPAANSLATEQQRALIQRVLNSTQFRKSPRLSAFLEFICEQLAQGRAALINEQLIGTAVFGRKPGYHVGEDSIVRSQARFLRQRLQEYFATEGRGEPWIIVMPKGSYVPAFEQRPADEAPIPTPPLNANAAQTPPVVIASVPQPGTQALHTPRLKGSSWIQFVILGAMLCLVLAAGSFYFRHAKAAEMQRASQTPEAQFWNSIFDPARNQIIVPSDSTLVQMEEFTRTPVSLSSYMNHDYLASISSALVPGWESLKTSQYTSMADLNLVYRIERRTEAINSHLQVRFARDVDLHELKQSNVILIGGARANPWVELFYPEMHFQVDYDWKTHSNIVWNRAPQQGEKDRYEELGPQGGHIAYGAIAYVPSLDGEGSALIVGGTTKAGTEAAAEFLVSTGFASFLRTLAPNRPLPHFEVLLSTESINDDSHESSIVAFHRLDTHTASHQNQP
jgi:hypothetical protein